MRLLKRVATACLVSLDVVLLIMFAIGLFDFVANRIAFARLNRWTQFVETAPLEVDAAQRILAGDCRNRTPVVDHGKIGFSCVTHMYIGWEKTSEIRLYVHRQSDETVVGLWVAGIRGYEQLFAIARSSATSKFTDGLYAGGGRGRIIRLPGNRTDCRVNLNRDFFLGPNIHPNLVFAADVSCP